MRKIESEMLAAIRAGTRFMKDNTAVQINDAGGAEVYLHGNHIASVDRWTGVVVVNTKTLLAWPTRTTLSRLRALGVDVRIHRGEVFMDDELVTY